MTYSNFLFSDAELSDVLRAQERRVPERVAAIPQDQFLVSNDTQLMEHLLTSLIIDPIILHEERMAMEQCETQVDVSRDRMRGAHSRQGPCYIPGTKVKVFIPFTGDRKLWNLKPSTWRSSFPIAVIEPGGRDCAGSVLIEMSQPHDKNPELFKKFLDDTLDDIHFYIKNQEVEIRQLNDRLPLCLERAISARRERIEKHSNISCLLDIPLRKKDGVPDIVPINLKQKIIAELPPVPKGGFKPEPGIRAEQYENILNVIRHHCKTWETTPGTYQKLEEEELRDILNAQLNGVYEGAAVGEVFRKKGKTDICIEDKDRAAFIAECKIWSGEKDLNDALEQLLSYLTWRDCKTALIFFNKTVAGFSAIQAKAAASLDKHVRLINKERVDNAGEWRYTFKSYDDEERAITVHLFLFNIYLRPEPKIRAI
jgi:hypothetical protein